MSNINTSTQLKTFSIIRSIIRTNAILGAKFSVKDFYEFDPHLKSYGNSSFNGFPFMLLKIPELDDMEEYLGNVIKHKEFVVDITLVMEFVARDSFAEYASNLISIIESSNATFQSSGYNLVSIKSNGSPTVNVRSEKDVVEGSFTLTLQGELTI